jgi:hypothetical protein
VKKPIDLIQNGESDRDASDTRDLVLSSQQITRVFIHIAIPVDTVGLQRPKPYSFVL